MSEKLSEFVLHHFTHLLPPFSFFKRTEKSAKSHMQVSGPTERLVQKNSLYRVGESEDFGEGITWFSGGYGGV